ncbi:MAG: Fe-S cluster assembly protein SufD [Candidatus Marinimicrobia bacterium]|nr:Fe-S cluster assembly protein SufD [Candidatus Neomarinimicrobiota bacterium]
MTLSHFQIEFEKMINRDYFSDKIHPMRKEAFSKFIQNGLPTKKWEDWRFTNLASITTKEFHLSEVKDSPKGTIDLSPYQIEDVDTIVIYNGHYLESLSSTPPGLKLLSGLEYLSSKKGTFENSDNSPFDLLNTAFMDSGIAIIVEPNTNIKKPLRLLFISSGKNHLMVSPRVHIDVEESSSLFFIEQHVSQNSESYFQNESVFISVENNSQLDHIRIQSNSESTTNMANLHVKQQADSQYSFFQFADGCTLGRLNIYAKLKGEGADCALNGIALSTGNQHLGHHIIIDHKVPNCTSSQNFKSILQDQSSGVYSGRTIVRKDAQKTNSTQSNKNLLLSKDALMHSIPQLEIDADDVKCAHGSSTGALDDEALFYLRSRGLDILSAKKLLVHGFVSEMIETIKHEPTKNSIHSQLQNWLIHYS